MGENRYRAEVEIRVRVIEAGGFPNEIEHFAPACRRKLFQDAAMPSDPGKMSQTSPPLVFGRRKGKTLRAYQSELMARVLPTLRADELLTAIAPESRCGPDMQIWLEIGFGGGEHLAAQATAHPDVRFIGCEPFVNGVAKLVANVEQASLRNVHVHADDAIKLIDRLPDGTIDRLYILFPDPWPKRRHKKRRLFNEATLRKFSRIMKDGAELRFATDIDDYAGWSLAKILDSADFSWAAESADDWMRPWTGHHVTRYETKAASAGRKPVYLTFHRSRRSP